MASGRRGPVERASFNDSSAGTAQKKTSDFRPKNQLPFHALTMGQKPQIARSFLINFPLAFTAENGAFRRQEITGFLTPHSSHPVDQNHDQSPSQNQ